MNFRLHNTFKTCERSKDRLIINDHDSNKCSRIHSFNFNRRYFGCTCTSDEHQLKRVYILYSFDLLFMFWSSKLFAIINFDEKGKLADKSQQR